MVNGESIDSLTLFRSYKFILSSEAGNIEPTSRIMIKWVIWRKKNYFSSLPIPIVVVVVAPFPFFPHPVPGIMVFTGPGFNHPK
jgi:hypothetical protein